MVKEISNFFLTAQQEEKIESGLFWKFDPAIEFQDPLPEAQLDQYIQSCIENWCP